MLPSAAPPGPPRKGSRWDATPIYHPSIYTYTCRGAYFVSSDQPGSEGSCRGIRTRLQLLSDMDAATREGAIKNFTYMTDYELDEDDAANSLNQKTKSILISPALIYREDATEQGRSDGDRPVLETPRSGSVLPEEELIKHQQWSCYGSTEVELLVLKNERSGREHIAAVAPRNAGISIRKIQADEGSITSIGVGWLNIVVDAGPAFVEDEQDDDFDEHDDEQHQQQPALDPSKRPLLDDSREPSSNRLPEEVPPRPSQDSIAKAKVHLTRYVEFGGKVAEQMKANAAWLHETLQDDFPSRTLAAGQKIATQLPRTVDHTAAFARKVWDRWWSGDDRGGGSGSND